MHLVIQAIAKVRILLVFHYCRQYNFCDKGNISTQFLWYSISVSCIFCLSVALNNRFICMLPGTNKKS